MNISGDVAAERGLRAGEQFGGGGGFGGWKWRCWKQVASVSYSSAGHSESISVGAAKDKNTVLIPIPLLSHS